MTGMEMKEKMMAERAAAFHGRCYWYNTPSDGRRTIGVMKGLGGDIWIVGYFRENGARRAVKSPHIRANYSPEVMQCSLDRWAKARELAEVA